MYECPEFRKQNWKCGNDMAMPRGSALSRPNTASTRTLANRSHVCLKKEDTYFHVPSTHTGMHTAHDALLQRADPAAARPGPDSGEHPAALHYRAPEESRVSRGGHADTCVLENSTEGRHSRKCKPFSEKYLLRHGRQACSLRAHHRALWKSLDCQLLTWEQEGEPHTRESK